VVAGWDRDARSVEGVDAGATVNFSPSGITFQGQLTFINEVYGAYAGAGVQGGGGVGGATPPGKSVAKGNWSGTAAGYGPSESVGITVTDDGAQVTGGSIAVGARAGRGYGAYIGQGRTRIFSYTIPWDWFTNWIPLACP
jgi:hypothetical protein